MITNLFYCFLFQCFLLHVLWFPLLLNNILNDTVGDFRLQYIVFHIDKGLVEHKKLSVKCEFTVYRYYGNVLIRHLQKHYPINYSLNFCYECVNLKLLLESNTRARRVCYYMLK